VEPLGLSSAERRFLAVLLSKGTRFMIVGMTGALLQGARGLTEDVDLWFEDLSDPRVDEAAREAGGFYVSGFGMRPPALGGDALGDRFDIVTHMHGLRPFPEEFAGAVRLELEGIELPVLPLERIVASKRASGRPKDEAVLPSLETALAVIEARDSENRD